MQKSQEEIDVYIQEQSVLLPFLTFLKAHTILSQPVTHDQILEEVSIGPITFVPLHIIKEDYLQSNSKQQESATGFLKYLKRSFSSSQTTGGDSKTAHRMDQHIVPKIEKIIFNNECVGWKISADLKTETVFMDYVISLIKLAPASLMFYELYTESQTSLHTCHCGICINCYIWNPQYTTGEIKVIMQKSILSQTPITKSHQHMFFSPSSSYSSSKSNNGASTEGTRDKNLKTVFELDSLSSSSSLPSSIFQTKEGKKCFEDMTDTLTSKYEAIYMDRLKTLNNNIRIFNLSTKLNYYNSMFLQNNNIASLVSASNKKNDDDKLDDSKKLPHDSVFPFFLPTDKTHVQHVAKDSISVDTTMQKLYSDIVSVVKKYNVPYSRNDYSDPVQVEKTRHLSIRFDSNAVISSNFILELLHKLDTSRRYYYIFEIKKYSDNTAGGCLGLELYYPHPIKNTSIFTTRDLIVTLNSQIKIDTYATQTESTPSKIHNEDQTSLKKSLDLIDDTQNMTGINVQEQKRDGLFNRFFGWNRNSSQQTIQQTLSTTTNTPKKRKLPEKSSGEKSSEISEEISDISIDRSIRNASMSGGQNETFSDRGVEPPTKKFKHDKI